jgi:hypothetical protein
MQKKAIQLQINGLVDDQLKVRCNLVNAQQSWKGWFEGLNERFISHPAWKIILVSSLEKLDKEHEIAMMQGKIAVEVITGCVHNLHEDNPLKVVLVLQEYFRKLHFTQELWGTEMDFRQPLRTEEKPDEQEMIKRKVE